MLQAFALNAVLFAGGGGRLPAASAQRPPRGHAAAGRRMTIQFAPVCATQEIAAFPWLTHVKPLSYMLTMSSIRHYAAVQQVGPGARQHGNWRIRRGSRAAGDGGPVLSNGLVLDLRDGPRGAAARARLRRRDASSTSRIPLNPFAHTTYGKTHGGGGRTVRALDAALRQAGLGHQLRPGRRRARADSHHDRCGSGRSAGCCISSACSVTRRGGRSRSC